MIGIVIVGHSNISKEFLVALEHISGKQENIVAISIFPDDDIKKKREEIIKSVKKVNKGKGVVILTDMFGGTPSNLAISIMEGSKIDVIAGVNLPMLVKLTSVRSTLTFPEAVDQAKEAGQKYIMTASQILGQEK